MPHELPLSEAGTQQAWAEDRSCKASQTVPAQAGKAV